MEEEHRGRTVPGQQQIGGFRVLGLLGPVAAGDDLPAAGLLARHPGGTGIGKKGRIVQLPSTVKEFNDMISQSGVKLYVGLAAYKIGDAQQGGSEWVQNTDMMVLVVPRRADAKDLVPAHGGVDLLDQDVHLLPPPGRQALAGVRRLVGLGVKGGGGVGPGGSVAGAVKKELANLIDVLS